MPPTATITVLLTLVLDTTLGEFPDRIHPVVFFGSLIHHVDRDWPTPRLAGSLIAIALPLIAAAFLHELTRIATTTHAGLAVVVGTLALFSATSLNRLLTTATTVIDHTTEEPDKARRTIHALVGRDPTQLSPSELRSAVVESLAENLADGLIAPLLAFTLGALISFPLAIAAATWVKAVNTLDSMIGYPDHQLGQASARLDDITMWIPARLTALLIALTTRHPRALRDATRDAHRPQSPNSGWPMAILAHVLDTQLTKPHEYTLNTTANLPTPETARAAVRIVSTTGITAFLITGGVAWF